MRAILIDPFTKSVEEVTTNGKLDDIYRLLNVELITTVTLSDTDALFLDDEGLFVPKEQQEYFHWTGSMQPFAGRGLILGADWEGESADAEIDIDTVRKRVHFLDKTNLQPDDYTGWNITVF